MVNLITLIVLSIILAIFSFLMYTNPVLSYIILIVYNFWSIILYCFVKIDNRNYDTNIWSR